MSLSNPKASRPATRDASSASASIAALLTWFVPGAGHLMLGRALPALCLFALVEGLYLLGFALSDGMAFRYLDPELRGSLLAPILSAEAGNLGAFLYQLRNAYGDGQPIPWPDHMRLGSMLCAASGVLNACVIAHAHTLARVPLGIPRERDAHRMTGAALATWLVPGLGHLLTGRRMRAAVVFGLLVGLFALGTALAEGANLSRERHFYFWAGQFLVGLPALVTEAFFGDVRVTSDIPYRDAGLVFGCIAGLLNVLAMIDAYAGAEEQALGLAATPEAGASPGSASGSASESTPVVHAEGGRA